VMWLAQAALLFGSAGRFDWPMAWALLCAIVVVAVCGFAALDPELIAERSKPTPGFDRADAVLASISGLALIFIPLQVAGIDVGRLQVPHFPIEVRIAALGIFLLGNLFSIWVAHCNRFFSDFVRIQHERGHRPLTVQRTRDHDTGRGTSVSLTAEQVVTFEERGYPRLCQTFPRDVSLELQERMWAKLRDEFGIGAQCRLALTESLPPRHGCGRSQSVNVAVSDD